METSFDDCSTAASTADGVISFVNSIQLTHLSIRFAPDIKFEVSCFYNENVSAGTNLSLSTTETESSGLLGQGEYEFEAKYFTNSNFTDEFPESKLQILGETLYLMLAPKTALPDRVSYYVDYCKVSDTDENSVDFIADSCSTFDFLKTSISEFLTKGKIFVSYTSFDFGSQAEFTGDTNNQLTLTCGIVVCLDEDCPTEPATPCLH